MIRIAHISDLHLVEHGFEKRSTGAHYRLRYLNALRGMTPPAERYARALAALRAAASADHVVATGDLTEEGLPEQFEVLAAVLEESGIDAERITLVPGNHDYYAGRDAFDRALGGPLRAFARTSRASCVIELGGALLAPVSTAVSQTFLRSGGVLQGHDLERLAGLARRGHTVVVAQHHPPTRLGGALRHWIDGLHNAGSATALLQRHERLHVLHGHLHVQRSRSVLRGRSEQVHCAAAVVQDAAHVRFYEIDGRSLAPCAAPEPGETSARRSDVTIAVQL